MNNNPQRSNPQRSNPLANIGRAAALPLGIVGSATVVASSHDELTVRAAAAALAVLLTNMLVGFVTRCSWSKDSKRLFVAAVALPLALLSAYGAGMVADVPTNAGDVIIAMAAVLPIAMTLYDAILKPVGIATPQSSEPAPLASPANRPPNAPARPPQPTPGVYNAAQYASQQQRNPDRPTDYRPDTHVQPAVATPAANPPASYSQMIEQMIERRASALAEQIAQQQVREAFEQFTRGASGK